MIAVLSPSKSLNEKVIVDVELSVPHFQKDAEKLINILKKLDITEIKNLMKLSDNLAEENFIRYKTFKKSPLYPAAFLFNGDVFRGLNIKDFNDEEMDYGQDHILILSGLYGYLKFKDGIHPYRLEMGSKLKNPKGSNLYDYWEDRIYKAIIKKHKTDTIINLASNEYSKALKLNKSPLTIIDVEFLEKRGASYKQIPLYSKKARGLMARYMCKNKVDKVEDLKNFNLEDYTYNKGLSNKEKFVFTR